MKLDLDAIIGRIEQELLILESEGAMSPQEYQEKVDRYRSEISTLIDETLFLKPDIHGEMNLDLDVGYYYCKIALKGGNVLLSTWPELRERVSIQEHTFNSRYPEVAEDFRLARQENPEDSYIIVADANLSQGVLPKVLETLSLEEQKEILQNYSEKRKKSKHEEENHAVTFAGALEKKAALQEEWNKLEKSYNPDSLKNTVCVTLKDNLRLFQMLKKSLEREIHVEKIVEPLNQEAVYTLTVDGSPVYELSQNGRVFYLETTKASTPLRLSSANLGLFVQDDFKNLKTLQSLVGESDEPVYVDMWGNPLINEQYDFAKEAFRQVREGIEILPDSSNPKGIKHYGKGKSVPREIVFRTWGQNYLNELGPDSVVEGELLGSGGSYKAFYFDDQVVVEFDQEERATFVFDKSYFDSLRHWSRQEVRDSKPKGFNGRICHQECDQDTWQIRVLEYLC